MPIHVNTVGGMCRPEAHPGTGQTLHGGGGGGGGTCQGRGSCLRQRCWYGGIEHHNTFSDAADISFGMFPRLTEQRSDQHCDVASLLAQQLPLKGKSAPCAE